MYLNQEDPEWKRGAGGSLSEKPGSVFRSRFPKPLKTVKFITLSDKKVKAPGEKLRPLQQKRKEQIEALGFKVYVLDGIEQIGGILDDIQAT